MYIQGNIQKYNKNFENVIPAIEPSSFTTPEAILRLNGKGLIDRLRSNSPRVLGYDREEIVGQSINVLIPQISRTHLTGKVHAGADKSIRRKDVPMRACAVSRTGRPEPVLYFLKPANNRATAYKLSLFVRQQYPAWCNTRHAGHTAPGA